MDGSFPIDLLEDRGRTVSSTHGIGQFDVDWAHKSIGEALQRAPREYIYAQKWFGQPNLVSSWVEKEALTGVFEDPCRRTGSGLFACKGYPSLSALWEWMVQIDRIITVSEFLEEQRALDRLDEDPYQNIYVLYFGDHDPDGLEIPEVAEAQLTTILRVHGHRLKNTIPPITFKRVALTIDQIDEHSPPPFPAKATSSRYTKYVEQTGLDDAWELDALPPDTLQSLIEEEVLALWDSEVHNTMLDYAQEERVELKKRITAEWVKGLMEE